MATRRHAFRLYPSKTDEKVLLDARRMHCWLYNQCLADRRNQYRDSGKSVGYIDQQNLLPIFKMLIPSFEKLGSQALQATVKRVDLAYGGFFKGLRSYPKFKSILKYSGWTYPATAGWQANTTGQHGSVTLNGLGLTIPMRGQAKTWGNPTTLTIAYKPNEKKWYASFTVEVATEDVKFGSGSDLRYEKIGAYDLGTETALTLFDGENFEEFENPRFSQKTDEKVRKAAKRKRRKQGPIKGRKANGDKPAVKGRKPSKRWKQANRKESVLKAKAARQRKDWQHKLTSDIASRYDIGVTEKLNNKNMTKKAKKGSKRKCQKAGLNKSILSVGFGTLNKMVTYKLEAKGGIVVMLPTRELKPSQRCPECWTVHKDWAHLSNRYHVCGNCGFEMPRDKASTMVMYNAVLRLGHGNGPVNLGCLSSTDSAGKRKHTGAMKQLGQMKRQKSLARAESGVIETPSAYAVG
jgi:putative transposase